MCVRCANDHRISAGLIKLMDGFVELCFCSFEWFSRRVLLMKSGCSINVNV